MTLRTTSLALLTSLFFVVGGAHADDETGVGRTTPRVVSVTARIEPTPVRFAEPFALVVEIVRARGLEVRLPASIPEKAGLRVLGVARRTVDDLAESGADPTLVRERIAIPLLALDTEGLETPALTLVDGTGATHTVSALPVALVDDTPSDAGVDETAFAQARTHHTFHVVDTRPIASLAALAFGGALVLLLRRLLARAPLLVSPSSTPTPAAPREAADVTALRRLDALLAEGLLARGEVSPFVARLMDEVLRTYLEDRFAVAASTRTTREVAEDLLRVSAHGLDVARLRAVLETADLVKFAKAQVAVEAAHDMANHVRALVVATRVQVEGSAP